MPNLNRCMFMGNVTRDPELRVTPKGSPICQFSLAINREFKMESGEKREEVFFADIEVWGKQAETIAKYVTKGKPLYVECRAKTDQWEDKNTKEKRSRTKYVLEQFQFLGSGDRAPSAQQSGSTPDAPPSSAPRSQPSQTAGNATNGPGGGGVDDDVPFAPIGGPEM